ncbi:MAG: ATP-binding protein [Mycoplasmatales bacterium]
MFYSKEELLQDEDIKKFVEINNLDDSQIILNIGNLSKYKSDKLKYVISWNGSVNLSVKMPEQKLTNPGIEFLVSEHFNYMYTLEELEGNVSEKNNILKAIKFDKGFYLTGNNGTGKTYLAVAFANERFKAKNEKTLFIVLQDFIGLSKQYENKERTNFISRATHAKYLIIDDLGAEKVTDFSRDEVLLPLINTRLERGLSTIITSNYSQKDLLDRYSVNVKDSKQAKTLVSKLKELSPELILSGDDLRDS